MCKQRLLLIFKVIVSVLAVLAVVYFLGLIPLIDQFFKDASPAWKFYCFFIILVPIMGLIGALRENQHVLFFNLIINLILFVPIFIWMFVSFIQRFFIENDAALDSNLYKIIILLLSCVLFLLISLFEYLLVLELRKVEENEEQNLKEAEEGKPVEGNGSTTATK